MFSDEARRHYTKRASGLAGVLLLASCVGLIPQVVTAQQQSMQQQMLLSGHVNYSRISPPASGVKVIEEIFQRVRSAPQIAMKLNLRKQQQRLDVAQDPLQIRPKSSAGKTLPSPSLNIIAPAAPAMEIAAAPAGGADFGTVQMRAEPQVFAGARQFPLVAASNKPSAPGMWESNESEHKASQQVPDLSTAIGRLHGVMQNMNQVQSLGKMVREQAQSSQPRTAGGLSGSGGFLPPVNMGKDVTQTNYQSEADSLAGALADGEQSNRKADTRRRNDAAARDKDMPASTPVTASKKAKPAQLASSFASAKEEAGAGPVAGYRGINMDEKKAKLAMADIALLPPNVVTGIPLVHLGSSEQQASGALQSIGSMKQQKVLKWTVWSWARPTAKTGTSLQLYMRNGLLDAMRIFDSSLIGTDFGVNVGDSMARVKEKFGEPAFIVDEPQPGAGRNYIYPISQIGFQLARPAPGDQPRVVSVLIFNVK